MFTDNQVLFTAAEAATVTRMPLKAVNNAIDKKTISARITRAKGKPVRMVDERALVYLSLERQLMVDTTPRFRRKLFKAISDAVAARLTKVAVGALTVDLRAPRRDIGERIKELRRAEQIVDSNPEIMGGTPVFRGTRIPIHLIVDLLKQGETIESLHNGYPNLTGEMIRLAPIYAEAHPLRGRPRKPPLRGRRQSALVRVLLSERAAS